MVGLPRVSVPGSGQAFVTMLGYDIDHPLAVDECLVCGFIGFDCICDPARPHRRPTPPEIEEARQRRSACTPQRHNGGTP